MSRSAFLKSGNVFLWENSSSVPNKNEALDIGLYLVSIQSSKSLLKPVENVPHRRRTSLSVQQQVQNATVTDVISLGTAVNLNAV